MIDPWSILELSPGADVRRIKVQYAKLLKQTRPEQDPTGFQQLREAYEQALEAARSPQELEVKPLPASEPIGLATGPYPFEATPPATRALALAQETTSENLLEQRRQASHYGEERAFEHSLLERVLAAPDNTALLTAAVNQLQWLTPWQCWRMTAQQELALAYAMLGAMEPTTIALLAEPALFIDHIRTLRQQPWLGSMERSTLFESWMVHVLSEHHSWPVATFEGLCKVFGWGKETHPEPEWRWQQVNAQCELRRFIEDKQGLIARHDNTAHGVAARLLLTPGNTLRQLRLVQGRDDVWFACDRLHKTLCEQHPQILNAFPDANPRATAGLTLKPELPWLWVWIGWLTLAGLVLPPEITWRWTTQKELWQMFGMVPLVLTLACWLLGRAWTFCAKWLKPLDHWINDHWTPHWLHWPGVEIQLLRHGLPVATIAGGLALLKGSVALCYLALIASWLFLAPYRYPAIYARIHPPIARFYERHTQQLYLTVVLFVMLVCFICLGPSPSPSPSSLLLAPSVPQH